MSKFRTRRSLLVAGFALSLLAAIFWRPLATWSLFATWIGLDILVGQLYSEQPAAGYGPSAFGGYDHERARDLELATLRTLVKLDPKEPYFRYYLASSFWRCMDFDTAASLYDDLLAEDPPFTAARLQLAILEWQRGRESEAEAHIQAHREEAKEVGGAPMLSRAAFEGMPRFSPEQLRARTCK